ncbi:DUF6364 family protein [Algoriphagus resistens]|uniref:DUF6364 family protein n=1 Tax=Algoriphagus resistens TaxID=1750590 RepID=UPI0007169B66|nr:DUF6364 family protein [Algoriphagus resistens]
MDAKVTLSFNKDVIDRAKSFAEENSISLSRLTEYLYSKITSKNYKSLEELPVSDWVDFVAEGRVEYRKSQTRKELKDGFFSSKK